MRTHTNNSKNLSSSLKVWAGPTRRSALSRSALTIIALWSKTLSFLWMAKVILSFEISSTKAHKIDAARPALCSISETQKTTKSSKVKTNKLLRNSLPISAYQLTLWNKEAIVVITSPRWTSMTRVICDRVVRRLCGRVPLWPRRLPRTHSHNFSSRVDMLPVLIGMLTITGKQAQS